MKRKDIDNSLVLERHSESGVISYSAKCPWFDECGHSDESNANYGDEAGAQHVTVGKILAHVVRFHGVKFDPEDGNEEA